MEQTNKPQKSVLWAKKRQKLIRGLFLAALALVAVATTLIAFTDFRANSTRSYLLFNAGVDVLGAFICLMLYYGISGGQPRQLAEARTFAMLILQNSLAFFFNLCIWKLKGDPDHRFLFLLSNVLGDTCDLLLIYSFWRYIRVTLEIDNTDPVSRRIDRVVTLALIPAILSVLVNLVAPVFFWVGEQGNLMTGAHYWLTDAYLVLVIVLALVDIFRSRASLRNKLVAASFGFIPTLHYLLTQGGSTYATQYGASLLAIVLMYGVLYTDRSNRLASAQTELQTAAEIQASALPSVFPPFPERTEFELYASMDPARDVGGDFFDFFLVDEDHLCLIIADVSGKGVPAALFMMSSKIILSHLARTGLCPSEILRNANNEICTGNQKGMFVTVWLGILEISTGKLTAANAGHEYPAFRHGDGRFDLFQDPHGLVCGGISGIPYREYVVQLEPGARVFVYTDGVAEATNARNELFGTDRMIEALNREPDADPQTLLQHVRRAVDDFVQEAEQFDDLTMLCLAYRGPSSRP